MDAKVKGSYIFSILRDTRLSASLKILFSGCLSLVDLTMDRFMIQSTRKRSTSKILSNNMNVIAPMLKHSVRSSSTDNSAFMKMEEQNYLCMKYDEDDTFYTVPKFSYQVIFNNYLNNLFSKKPSFYKLMYTLKQEESLFCNDYKRRRKTDEIDILIEKYKTKESKLIDNRKTWK
ncbi:hypothetical protein H8356DRAFT_1338181 [Neocallimastix lanati (nom. inval.)]|nr:hypothetical protein H8356DRAFT_1338181 [Neocallimastix sp. JGI-2020a]